MAFRWTQKELEEYDTIDFAIAVLTERSQSTTNVYSPLNKKISKVQNELKEIKEKLNEIDYPIKSGWYK